MTSLIQAHPVPRGWRRVVAVDAVYYVSPDKCCLWNLKDVVKHLSSRGTCKCGLQCPIDIDIVFNFNRDVPTGHELSTPTGSCAHNPRKLKRISAEATESHNSGKPVSCDPQEVSSKSNEMKQDDMTVPHGLQASGPEVMHNVSELLPQEADKPDSASQLDITNTGYLYGLDADDILLETIMEFDISPQETQVFAINRSDIDDNLLRINDAKVDAKVLHVSQEEQLCNSSDQTANSISNSTDCNLEKPLLSNNPPIAALSKLTSQQKPPSPQKLSSLQKSQSPSPQKLPSPQKSSSQKSPSAQKSLSSQESLSLQRSLHLRRSPSPKKDFPSPQKSLSPQISPSLQIPSSPQILLSPQKSLCSQQESSFPQHGLPCPQIKSLSPQESLKTSPASREMSLPKADPPVKLVDYYDADTDTDDDVTMESDVIHNDMMDPVGYYSDTTESLSDDSDSNSLVHKRKVNKITTVSNYLAHDWSDTGTTSSDTDVRDSMEPAVWLSPQQSYLKNFTQKFCILNKDAVPVGVNASAGSFDDKAIVHAVETCHSVSTISTIAATSVSTEVLSSISNLSISSTSTMAASVHSAAFNNAAKSVSSVDTTVSTGAVSDNSSVSDKNPSSSLLPITTSHTTTACPSSSSCKDTVVSKDTFVSNEGTPVTSAEKQDINEDAKPVVKFSTGFVLPSVVKKTVCYGVVPVSTQLPIPESIPITRSSSVPKLRTSDSLQSSTISIPFSEVCNSSIPVPSSQVCSTSIPNISSQVWSSSIPIPSSQVCSSSVTIQPSLERSTTEESYSPNESRLSALSAVSSDEDCESVNNPTPRLTGNQRSDRKESSSVDSEDGKDDRIDGSIDDKEGSVSTFPAALKLSVDLSVLPQKRKVLQRAKWAALLTTPVPVLRERKKPIKSTVTVESTVIKSDRPKSSPKKRLQVCDSTDQPEVGQVLWCKFSYWNPWPCKIILHSDVGQLEPPPDQVWVEWYGDHSYSKVDRSSLKPYEEGLQHYLANKNKRSKHSRKLNKAVSEVRNLIEGLPAAKATTKRKKQPHDVQKDNAASEKEGCPS